ncbi:MAG: ATP-binding cassette domain-containing protein [Christensenellales bacterium]|jgi:putative ABC transport system permease protein
MIRLENIKKDYYVAGQTINALKGISLEFSANEFVCILGPSGCGKTTLMNIIGGLDRATSGELFFNEIPTEKFKDTDWDNYRNKKIGFVFQSYNLIPHISVIANVELALTLSGISIQERHAKAKEALDKVGLSKEYNKKPNQLSGGQMQRVAIARAIINSPEVLLLDEPTGALDTQTSIQILDLIKEIAKDKLVIMVTHNAELAEKYGTRIIHLRDGLLNSDSEADSRKVRITDIEKPSQPKVRAKLSAKKTSMSFFTALRLSLTNLLTKKGRTVMTALAGSIGIIGIALILSLSNGMNIYISKMQTDTLAGYPITVTTTSIDVAQVMKLMRQQGNVQADYEKFPLAEKIIAEKSVDLTKLLLRNDITDDYIQYLKQNLDTAAYNDIIYKTGMDLNIYGIKEGSEVYTKISTGGNSYVPTDGGVSWQMLLEEDFLATQYDVLAGNMPKDKSEIALIVNEGNRLFDYTLYALGLTESRDAGAEIPFEQILGKEYKVITNNELYTFLGQKFTKHAINELDFDSALTIKISGILRINRATQTGSLVPGIGYTKELYGWLQSENMSSEIVQWMRDNPDKHPDTGDKIASNESLLRSLGGIDIPNEINIFPKDFAAKEIIKNTLDAYSAPDGGKIVYTDMSEIMGDMMSTFVNIISWVLIAFTAISLIVSSIMIGIITYVSVLERTKEIGILRAIGARKIDVSRVFNAETFIIGLASGIVGVSFTLLVSIPINMLTKTYLDVERLAVLGPLYSVILVLISIGLTILSGLLPAKNAAKKDPVLALRTE